MRCRKIETAPFWRFVCKSSAASLFAIKMRILGNGPAAEAALEEIHTLAPGCPWATEELIEPESLPKLTSCDAAAGPARLLLRRSRRRSR